MSVLHVRHDVIRRGRQDVLEAGEFTIPLPAAIAVVGINGSGKSSLFMHLTDCLARAPQHAVVDVGGTTPTIAYAPQTPALPPWLRVNHVASLYGASFNDLVRTMPSLHLEEMRGRRAGALSLGQQQTLSIALALSQPARLMILDEPFSALDFRRRIGALDLLRGWKAAHPDRALLLSSQNAADLVDVCDYFVVIRDGRYVFTGPRTHLTPDSDNTSLQNVERHLLALLM